MSALESKIIDQLLTPEVMAAVDPALAGLGIEALDRVRESFTGCFTWVQAFGTTTGTFDGFGGAAVTDFRLTIVHSPVTMILFANNERYDLARLFGVAPFDASVIDNRDWTVFALISGS